MLRRNIVGLVICVAALGVSTLGVAGIPDLVNSNADLPAGTPQVSVFLTPDGTGNLMTEARAVNTPPLDVVNATITVTLLDAGMNPVFAYPFEDMWLETTLGGLVACTNGTLANANTDINGVSTFVGPFYAGGYSNKLAGELTQVIINGSPLVNEDLNVLFNSPDLFADGVVDLSDVSLFSASYGSTDYRANYFYDNTVNLSDLVLFSSSVNVVCP
ncbi:MAG: hypothetical protein Q7W56_02430 [Candidatus Latescibacteria bacterium]|nr:hypothetical protein [Candidatus Latescibacterota bacterium]